MQRPTALLLAFLALSAPAAARGQDADDLLRRAAELYDRGSFEEAHRLYLEADALALEGPTGRFVDLRVADTRWRSAAASANPDSSRLDAARVELEALLRAYDDPAERDEVWAKAQASLADFHWDREGSSNWGAAQEHYAAALDWWAGSRDVERARAEYLGLVRTMLLPAWLSGDRWSWYGDRVDLRTLEQAASIAVEPADKGLTQFFLGVAYQRQGGAPERQALAPERYRAVIELGPGPWYDDALYQLGTFLEQFGELVHEQDGSARWRPDYAGALEAYRRLTSELAKGETRYHDDARERIRRITEPTVEVSVERFFVPGSEVAFRLGWRNVADVELLLVPVDLTRDAEVEGGDPNAFERHLRIDQAEPIARWSHATGDDGAHRPGSEELVVAEAPPTGAYVLVARGGGVEARALVLVSDALLSVKQSGRVVLGFLTDLETGRPLPEARAFLWERWHDGQAWRSRTAQGVTGPDGTVLFERASESGNAQLFVSAALGARQAFAAGSGWWRGEDRDGRWNAYAFTDRPAYRPSDAVKWKVIARVHRADGYETPRDQTLHYQVLDPRGQVAGEGDVTLNAFGAAWGTFETTPEQPLGLYQLQLRHGGDVVASAQLFRLEEYKLPEFEVSVELPKDEDGAARTFRLGDVVEAAVQARYYFGAPVGGAAVEVLVYQRPYQHFWPRPVDYPWYRSERLPHPGWWGGPGQLVLRETLTADAEGRARLELPTQRGLSDLEYTIEARVVDASRREVTASSTLRVTRQAFFVRIDPKHAIHAPGETIELELGAQDANGGPVAADGEVVVTRDTWREIWRRPDGREVQGQDLIELRERLAIFPPPGEPGWRLIFDGYEREEVARGRARTGADGKGSWSFRAEREGTYTATFRCRDDRGERVEAATTLFVADERTRDLGYRRGGVDLIVDKDTFAVGQRAAVVLATPASDRWVLFTIEGAELFHHEVVHVEGTAKLLYVDVLDAHVPNVWLGALSVADRQAWSDVEEVVVPPVRHFLDVEVALDREAYLPGAHGRATVTVRDHEGRPVRGEVALGVYDEAVAAIQGELAADPRQHFFGERAPQAVLTRTTLNHKGFEELVETDDGVVRERHARARDGRADAREEQAMLESLGYAGEVAADAFFLGEGARREKAGLAFAGAPAPAAQAAGAPDLGQVRVRSDFRDTALWIAAVVTDDEGKATFAVPFPDSTTRWKAVARVADEGARFGAGEASARTRQPLIARLATPRFLQVGDELTVSGNLSNQTEAALIVHATLEVEGARLLGRLAGGELAEPHTGALEIPAGGEVRVDWRLAVDAPGEARLVLKAASPEHQDGMERLLPVQAHGIEALIARSGRLTADELALTLDVPAHAAGSLSFEVQVTPSLAVTMLDALPYLVHYPYGCTEQTLSRFVPAAVVARTLRDVGLSPEDALKQRFGGIEAEHVEKTHPKGTGAFEELDRVIADGLQRLYDMQHADGGWGWWKEGDSDHWMSAYVVWGLSIAEQADVEVRADVIERATRFLELKIVERELDVDVQSWMLYALALRLARTEAASAPADAAFQNLYAKRAGLNAYGRALLALAAQALGRDAEARVLVENLANGVIRDDRPDASVVMQGGAGARDDALKTAHWGEDGVSYRWSEGGVEATAFALRALLAIQPDHELVQPALTWLVKNRRAAQWSNTRDTAIVVLTLAEHLKRSGELGADVAYDVLVNGTRVAETRLAKDELLTAPSVIQVDPALCRAGANEVRIVRRAGGPLYFAAYARFQSAEEPIPARGSEIFVRREHYRLKPVETLLKGVVYEKELLADGARVESGDRIEVVITAEAKNHLEYLVFEDKKPAGFEAVQVQSGGWMLANELKSSEVERRFVEGGRREEVRIPGLGRGPIPLSYRPDEGYTGRSRGLHQELRDRHVALFADRLPQGTWEMRYELRAETPGAFHALPLVVHAMYAPEIRGNSTELVVEVVDR